MRAHSQPDIARARGAHRATVGPQKPLPQELRQVIFSFDTTKIAECYGIPTAELGVAHVPHRLDGNDYESVLLFDKRRVAP